jgi:hypothetical protein
LREEPKEERKGEREITKLSFNLLSGRSKISDFSFESTLLILQRSKRKKDE